MSGRSSQLALPNSPRPQSTRRVAAALLLAFLAVLLPDCASAPKRPIPFMGLSSNFEPLRAQFNKDAGKVRLVILLDPT